MGFIDAFNGDADGLCALQQLRLAKPVSSTLVTGTKRDISLLKRIEANENDQVTVLDISLDKNRDGLNNLLTKGVHVHYFDHHFAGDIPNHASLVTHIDTSADTCTSLIVNQHLQNKQALWAIVGAFGDNLDDNARAVATPLNLNDKQVSALKELGILINYNAYGATVADLHFQPADLFKQLHPYADPLAFITECDAFSQLRSGYHDDTAKAEKITPDFEAPGHALYSFPAEPWARRISGVFANQLAQNAPKRAHALLTHLSDNDGFLVSVRAPLANKQGADDLCRQFDTGGGRKAAAGINHLPSDSLTTFIDKFKKSYP